MEKYATFYFAKVVEEEESEFEHLYIPYNPKLQGMCQLTPGHSAEEREKWIKEIEDFEQKWFAKRKEERRIEKVRRKLNFSQDVEKYTENYSVKDRAN